MDLLKDVKVDIIRCENVLKENDYMEIVIAIEELQDKYRYTIENISEHENNVVWNYSKKDLEKIKQHLVDYKNEMIIKEKVKEMGEKIAYLKKYIKDNNIQYENEVKEIINYIEDVNNMDESLDKKYEKLKFCFDLLKNLDRKIGTYILELIILVTK